MKRGAPLILVALVGCHEPQSVDQSIVKAVQTESKQEKAAELARKHAEYVREQKAATKKALEDKRTAEIEAAAVLPQPMPADLEAACQLVVDAFDGFIRAGSDEREIIAYFQGGRRKKRAEQRGNCLAHANLQVAACIANAIQQDLASFSDLKRVDVLRRVSTRCVEKFGSKAG